MWRFTQVDEELIKNSTDKNVLFFVYNRLNKEFGQSFIKWQFRTSPCFSECQPFHFHPFMRVSLNHFKASPNCMMLGKVFLCRTISPCIKMLSVLTVVEFPDADLKDQAVFLSLHNYQQPSDEKKERSIPVFTKGTILAVINPMFCQSSSNQIYTVRSYNPGDVSVLSQDQFEKLFPELSWPSEKLQNKCLSIFPKSLSLKVWDWKSVGHYWLGKKNYVTAIKAYSLALDHNNDFEALSLRCSLHLQLKLYKKSLHDATEILNRFPNHNEAICHKASSLIGLSQYTSAEAFLTDNIERCTSLVDSLKKEKLMELLIKSKTWSKQERYGDYDLVKMFRCSKSHYHDCADYTGNVVEQVVPGKGRGMIATENIKCGDLILGAKALEIAIVEKEKETETWLLDTATRMNQPSARIRLLVSIAYRLILDPSLGKTFYNLYDGSPKPEESNSCKPEDEFVEMEKLALIYSYNAFSERFYAGEENRSVVGIWPSCSLFNHGGFDSNSRWKICGNFMFVRASKDINKGDEISLSYNSLTSEYHDRLSALSKYGFVCDCTLCLFDAKEPLKIHIRREGILREINDLFLLPCPSCSRIEKLIEELQQQRPCNLEHNVYTINPKLWFAGIYKSNREYFKASEILCSVYEITSKTVLIDLSLICCYNGLICSLKCKNLVSRKFWCSALKTIFTQEYGTYSKELLKCEAEHVVKYMKKYGVEL